MADWEWKRECRHAHRDMTSYWERCNLHPFAGHTKISWLSLYVSILSEKYIYRIVPSSLDIDTGNFLDFAGYLSASKYQQWKAEFSSFIFSETLSAKENSVFYLVKTYIISHSLSQYYHIYFILITDHCKGMSSSLLFYFILTSFSLIHCLI